MSSDAAEFLFVIMMLVISFFYSSVGHGGASGYIALLTIWGETTNVTRSSSLLLNALVSLIAFVQYYREGHFKWKLFYPFIITSVPMAYLGSRFDVKPNIYNAILGILLIISVIRMLGYGNRERSKFKRIYLPYAMLAGAIIGFLSGLIGIGGGILLSPLILMMGWGGMKSTAATSALFIFVNSLAGISGLLVNQSLSFYSKMVFWIVAAIIGGGLGAFWGSQRAKVRQMSYVLAAVLAVAALKLLFF